MLFESRKLAVAMSTEVCPKERLEFGEFVDVCNGELGFVRLADGVEVAVQGCPVLDP